MPDTTTQLKPSAFIMEDHKLFAESFSVILENTGIFERVLIFDKEDDLIQFLIKNRNPGKAFLFLDYYLENKTITHILDYLKRIKQNAHTIIVSCIANPVLIKGLMEFNPDGIVSKTDGVNEILDCMYAISRGAKYTSPGINELLERAVDDVMGLPLSNREIEILQHFAQGFTVDATATKLNLSRHTVAAHRRKMFAKTKVNNIAELLAYARKIELL